MFDGLAKQSQTLPVMSALPMPQRRPYMCPICQGRGTVAAGFYTGGLATSTTPEKCRACSGSGIVRA